MNCQLHEQYRPTAFGDVVGQSKAIAKLKALAKRGLAGRSYWISGQSGTGKTTLARIVASEVAEHHCIGEVDSQWLTPARLDDLERHLQVYGMGPKGGRALIINEAHGLSKTAIRQLLVMLERLPAHVVIVFTTTVEGQAKLFDDVDDAAPLLSRCQVIELARRGLAEAFAERARTIAQAEGLDGQPIEKYLRLAKNHRNNMRAMLQEIEAGGMLE